MRLLMGLMVCGVVVGLGTAQLGAPEAVEQGGHFADAQRVQNLMDNDPGKVVAALEAQLSQQLLDTLEAALFPPATAEEQAAALAAMQLQLKRLGLSKDDTVAQAIDARLTELNKAAAERVEAGQ